jgi:hypothetical protein
MKKGFRFMQHRFIIVLFLLSVLTGGCGGGPVIFPTSTPVPCTSDVAGGNIYRAEPQWGANVIFEYVYPVPLTPQPSSTPDPLNALTPTPAPTPTSPPVPPDVKQQQLQSARYAAFQYLINETIRWSDVETIKFNDSSEAEIVITFISPELLQAVFLNNSLKDLTVTSDFQTQFRNALESVAGREELLFMITVTSAGNNTNLNNHVVKIPIGSLVLNNAENAQVPPTHSDYNLGQPINSSAEAVFGYLAYPLVRQPSADKCKLTLDPKFDTNIVISLLNTSIEVDGFPGGPYSWTIPYAALLNAPSSPEAPAFAIPAGYDLNQVSPLQTPPSGIKQGNRWQDYARFLWSKITLR